MELIFYILYRVCLKGPRKNTNGGCGPGYKGDLCLECNTFVLAKITTRIFNKFTY